jgi:hypothetical protein
MPTLLLLAGGCGVETDEVAGRVELETLGPKLGVISNQDHC